MIQNEKVRMAVNRIASFVVGGLLVYVVFSASVVSNLKAKNVELTNALSTSQYEPTRLLADAKAQIANRKYAKAKVTLTVLLEKRPGPTLRRAPFPGSICCDSRTT
jgi:hypothetical protein